VCSVSCGDDRGVRRWACPATDAPHPCSGTLARFDGPGRSCMGHLNRARTSNTAEHGSPKRPSRMVTSRRSSRGQGKPVQAKGGRSGRDGRARTFGLPRCRSSAIENPATGEPCAVKSPCPRFGEGRDRKRPGSGTSPAALLTDVARRHAGNAHTPPRSSVFALSQEGRLKRLTTLHKSYQWLSRRGNTTFSSEDRDT